MLRLCVRPRYPKRRQCWATDVAGNVSTGRMTSPMRSSRHPALVFVVIFVALFLLHAPLLQLPYFWDEAGYYVPAARDLLLSGSLIPHTTVSNAHPPLVLAWIAMWWKCFGYAPAVARSAMLVIASFSLLGVFRLAESVANTPVAIGATMCTAVYPVFFAQSSLAQVDLAAAGLTVWGLLAFVERRWRMAVDLVFPGSAGEGDCDSCSPRACGVGVGRTFYAEKWKATRIVAGACARIRSEAGSGAADSCSSARCLVLLSLCSNGIRFRQS